MTTGSGSPDEAVGEKIRRERERLGLTQRDLAERLASRGWAIDPTAVTRIEGGTRSLRVAQLYLLADALGVRPERLIVDDLGKMTGFRDVVTRELENARRSLSDAITVLSVMANYYENDVAGYKDAVRRIAPTPVALIDLFTDMLAARLPGWTAEQEGVTFTPEEEAAVWRLLNALLRGLYSVEPTEAEAWDGEHQEEA